VGQTRDQPATSPEIGVNPYFFMFSYLDSIRLDGNEAGEYC